jgi:hypothetical protein
MRCFFMKGGHIADVEVLEGLSDQEAVEKSRELFAARRGTNSTVSRFGSVSALFLPALGLANLENTARARRRLADRLSQPLDARVTEFLQLPPSQRY